eukprot:61513-Rhodomonas_salina.1
MSPYKRITSAADSARSRSFWRDAVFWRDASLSEWDLGPESLFFSAFKLCWDLARKDFPGAVSSFLQSGKAPGPGSGSGRVFLRLISGSGREHTPGEALHFTLTVRVPIRCARGEQRVSGPHNPRPSSTTARRRQREEVEERDCGHRQRRSVA